MSEEVIKVVKIYEQIGFKYKGIAYKFVITRDRNQVYDLAVYSLKSVNLDSLLKVTPLLLLEPPIAGKFIPVDEKLIELLKEIVEKYTAPKFEEITNLGEL
jgi:hypothetical protein